MISISKNAYINKLDDIVNEYNNRYHKTIKMKPIEIKDNTYIDSSEEVNDEISKFKVGDHVRISNYKNVLAKGYTPNWYEVVFVIKKVLWKTFYEKELQKTNQQELRIEKIIKKKGDNLYVKWKGYDDLFNSWIDKKD